MKNVITKLLIIGLAVFLIVPASGQDLEETLQSLVAQNGELYLNPVATAFGTAFNSGTFHTAKPHKLLGFDLKINVTGVTLPTEAETYEFQIGPDDVVTFPMEVVHAGQTISTDVTINLNDVVGADRTTSTFFGSDEEADYLIDINSNAAIDEIATQVADAAPAAANLTADDVKTNFGSDINAKINEYLKLGTPGVGLPGVAMITPQFSLGLPMDIELTLRGAPPIELGDAGEASFFGFGGKIGINQFVPVPIPFLPQVSVGYYMTNLTFGDVFTAKNSIMTLQASKSIPFLTVYGGFGLESSSMEVSYTPDPSTNLTNDIEFNIDGDNSFRTTVGVRLKLALISLNADYNMGEYSALNIGMGLTLR